MIPIIPYSHYYRVGGPPNQYSTFQAKYMDYGSISQSGNVPYSRSSLRQRAPMVRIRDNGHHIRIPLYSSARLLWC